MLRHRSTLTVGVETLFEDFAEPDGSEAAAVCTEVHVILNNIQPTTLARLSPRVAFVAASVLLLGSIPARAADLCVDKSGAGGCTKTIAAAVAAANPYDVIRVHAGTYHEDVIIPKPLSLVGDSQRSIIDATGLVNGVNVDGKNHAGLSHVLVTGFTVRNADAQGILVTNASYVTVDNNEVTGNDRALTPPVPPSDTPTCPAVPDYFQAGEGFDCGEGIHFSAVDHSVVSGNHVHHNAGGILTSDDTGPSHDNTIIGNIVEDNPYDCGITIASHHFSPVPVTDPSVGIYHIAVIGNISRRNGLAVGEGAGVGIFTGPPGGQNNSNVVVNNTLTDNGLPGVALHMHAPNQTLNDHLIIGNVISGNAGDPDLGTDPPPSMGISILAPVVPIKGVVITQNVFKREDIDIAINAVPGSSIAAHLNSFTAQTGIDNMAAGSIDATLNWWKCSKGPDAHGCSGVEGTGVLTDPWLTHPAQADDDGHGNGHND
jgi:hypothetical protein